MRPANLCFKSSDRSPRDAIVFSQGDPADAVFYVERGEVKVTVVSKQGKEAVVAMLGTNDFFGEGCLGGQAQRIATVATMTDSVIVRLEKAAILRVIHQEPAFSEMFIAHLLNRAIRVEADLVDQLFNSSEKRLARLLLLLAWRRRFLESWATACQDSAPVGRLQAQECNGEARPGVSLSPGRHEAADRCALSLGFSTMPSCAFRKMRLGHCEPHRSIDPDVAIPIPDLRDRARGLSWFEKPVR